MRAIIVMFDSLNRHMLSPYADTFVQAPNFERLAERTVMFDHFYAGSMPCMPARREMHSGRYNFLHRGWGPLEPFDDSMPELLRDSGVHTHLVTDHQHYWEAPAASRGAATHRGRRRRAGSGAAGRRRRAGRRAAANRAGRRSRGRELQGGDAGHRRVAVFTG